MPVNSVINSSATASASSNSANLSSDDFTRILLAQMASPDLSSLFNSNNDDENNSNPFGSGYSSSSLFGNLSSLLPPQLMAGSGSSLGGVSSQLMNAYSLGAVPSMQLSLWSNLIGKTVEATDPLTGKSVSGKVASVVMQNGSAMLDIGSLIDPAAVTKVS